MFIKTDSIFSEPSGPFTLGYDVC